MWIDGSLLNPGKSQIKSQSLINHKPAGDTGKRSKKQWEVEKQDGWLCKRQEGGHTN